MIIQYERTQVGACQICRPQWNCNLVVLRVFYLTCNMFTAQTGHWLREIHLFSLVGEQLYSRSWGGPKRMCGSTGLLFPAQHLPHITMRSWHYTLEVQLQGWSVIGFRSLHTSVCWSLHGRVSGLYSLCWGMSPWKSWVNWWHFRIWLWCRLIISLSARPPRDVPRESLSHLLANQVSYRSSLRRLIGLGSISFVTDFPGSAFLPLAPLPVSFSLWDSKKRSTSLGNFCRRPDGILRCIRNQCDRQVNRGFVGDEVLCKIGKFYSLPQTLETLLLWRQCYCRRLGMSADQNEQRFPQWQSMWQ